MQFFIWRVADKFNALQGLGVWSLSIFVIVQVKLSIWDRARYKEPLSIVN